MRTKNIFKTLAFAMLMPAMLLTTACSNQDDVANTSNITNKGYALPVTVNVTRGDGATRASYNESTRKLEFSNGDKLFVEGVHIAEKANRFAGTLTWQSGGTFSGTIYTQNQWTGTADALFSAASASGIVNATLLPNGYESYNFLSIYNNGSDDLYDDVVAWGMLKAFVASETAKATGVEQLSFERASTYSSGFALAPRNAILNFTITGLEAGAQDVTLYIDYGGVESPVTGSVTPNASGVATFAIGVTGGSNIKDRDNNLTIGSSNLTLPSSTTFTAGKIYNITRIAAPTIPAVALSGLFSVSATQQARFSQGNLQAVCTSADGDASTQETFTWRFAEHQWDYIGGNYSGGALTPTGNNFIDGSGSVSAAGTVDLFSWVGGSSSLTGVAAYGICLWGVGGNVAGEDLKLDWGSIFGGSWRMPSKDEWNYVFNTRSTTSGVRYAKATVNGVAGVILLPDDWSTSYYTLKSTNTSTAKFSVNSINSTNWTNSLEAHGAVFLPAAGDRSFGSVWNQNTYGTYWSNSSVAEDGNSAYSFRFSGGEVQTQYAANRGYGVSVRLICPVHP